MKYYLTTNTKNSNIYIAYHGKPIEPFLIQVKSRFDGDNLLRKLNGGIIKDPLKDSQKYLLDRTVTDEVLKGEVKIFILI